MHNLILFSVEALKCFVCSSDKLASCATLQMKDLPFELCPSNTESCFSRIESKVNFSIILFSKISRIPSTKL